LAEREGTLTKKKKKKPHPTQTPHLTPSKCLSGKRETRSVEKTKKGKGIKGVNSTEEKKEGEESTGSSN